jgi:hypothetical protein
VSARLARRILVAVSCLGCVSHPIQAHADEPPPFGINWVRLEGADSCLTAAELAQDVETYLDRVLFGAATTAKLFVDGHVRAAAASTWEATLELALPDGRRFGSRQLSLSGSDCSAIDDGVVFVIVLMLKDLRTSRIPLDPRLAALLDSLFPPLEPPLPPPPLNLISHGEQPRRPQASPPQPSQPPQPSDPAEPDGVTDVAQLRAGGVRIEASGIGSLGLLPGFSLGVAVHATLETAVIGSVELGVGHFPGRSVTASADGTARGRVDFALSAIFAGLCPLRPFSALALCAGADFAFVDVQRQGFAEAGLANPEPDSSHLSIIPRASGVIRLELGSLLLLRAAMGVAAPLRRDEFWFRTEGGERALFRTWPVVGRADIGLGATF